MCVGIYIDTHIKGRPLAEPSDIIGHCFMTAQPRVLFWILTQPFLGWWGCCSSPSALQIPFWVKSTGLGGQCRELIRLLEPSKAFRFWPCSSPYLGRFLFLQWLSGWGSPPVWCHRVSFPFALCVASILCVVRWVKESEDLGLPGGPGVAGGPVSDGKCHSNAHVLRDRLQRANGGGHAE